MKVSYPINYSGYIPVPRSILLLVKYRKITLSELGTYIYLITQASFDKRHRHYKAILRDDKELASEFLLSYTTIFRHRKKLIRVGLLTVENSLTKITNHHMFESDWLNKLIKLPSAFLQELFAKNIDNFADAEDFIANLQTVPPENPLQSFSNSSKSGSLSTDDMQWINEQYKDVK